jgi:predicted RNase H-like nuclease (RuvC/YqgF family)
MIEKYLKFLQEQEEILNEISPKVKMGLKIGAAGVVLAGYSSLVILGLIEALKNKKRNADIDYKKCIQNVENTIGKKYHQMNDFWNKNFETDKITYEFEKNLDIITNKYETAIYVCKKMYNEKIKKLKEKKKELEQKYKEAKAKERNSKK